MSNFDTALKAELKRVVRSFQHYGHEARAMHAAARVRRDAVGEYFYTHPDAPGLAFPTRKRAAMAAMARQ